MRSPYGLDIIESCITCPFREDRLFCNLSNAAVKELQEITSAAAYPKGALLFVEGQAPRGIFILCGGKAKLSTSASDGKTLILKIAEAGEVLGLSATVSGREYEVTVELLEPAQAKFVPRDKFLNFLKHHADAAFQVANQLSNSYHTAYEEIRSLGLSRSATTKLAKLLLEWSAGHDGKEPRITVTLTHEEMAQLIGASRETVTRAFADLKKRKLIDVKGSAVVLRDKNKLEQMVGS